MRREDADAGTSTRGALRATTPWSWARASPGLAAACHLASKGWSVAVLERAAEPGGSVRCAEIAPGFRADLGAMNLSLFAGGGFAKAHEAALARHGFALVPAADAFATSFPDGTWLGVSTDAEATAARIAALSEADAAAWREMAAAFPEEARARRGAAVHADDGRSALGAFAWRVWRAKGTAWGLEKLRFLLSSPRAFLDERFEHPHVKAMMAVWGMHLDFAPSVAGGAVFPYLESMAGQAFGMVIGRGGADTAIRAMTGYLAELGGTLETGTEVVAVTRAGRRATGVVLGDGRRIAARRAVIAGLAPGGLLQLLRDGSGEPAYDARMRRFRHGPGTMMIHLALDGAPRWRAGEALGRFAYVHLAPSMAAMDLAYAQAMAGLLPAEPGIVVGQPTAVDPSRAPEGRHVLWVQVRVVPAAITGDAKGEIDATGWAEAKEPFAERILDLIERHAPGLRGLIAARRVVSPADLEAWNPNLVGGDQVAGSHHLAQNFLFRPVLGRADWSTPVRGLHQIGASTWPGGGTGAGSGYMLARRLAGG